MTKCPPPPQLYYLMPSVESVNIVTLCICFCGKAPNLRISQKLSKAHQNQGKCQGLRVPFKGILNAL